MCQGQTLGVSQESRSTIELPRDERPPAGTGKRQPAFRWVDYLGWSSHTVSSTMRAAMNTIGYVVVLILLGVCGLAQSTPVASRACFETEQKQLDFLDWRVEPDLAGPESRRSRAWQQQHQENPGRLCGRGKFLRRERDAFAGSQRFHFRRTGQTMEADLGGQRGWLSGFCRRYQRWSDEFLAGVQKA